MYIVYIPSYVAICLWQGSVQCSPDMVKEGGGAVILLLTSAQYLSGIPTAFSSASLRCLISSSFLRLQNIIMTLQYLGMYWCNISFTSRSVASSSPGLQLWHSGLFRINTCKEDLGDCLYHFGSVCQFKVPV